MKTITKTVLASGVTALAVTTMFATSAHRQGTEVVHYSVRVAMTNDNVETSASGSVQATQATQGNADHETLTITAKGLTPGLDYSVSAITNGVSTGDIGDFTADSKGGGKAMFSTNGKSKKNLGPPPTPLTSVTEVDIVNSTNSVAVLTADMTTPTSLKYMVKKEATVGNVSAGFNLSASNTGEKVSLAASGLTAGLDYILVLGSNPVATNTANAKGDLKVSASGSSNGILDVNSISLTDTNSTTVWTTTIP